MEIYRELYQISNSLSEFTHKAKRLHMLMKQEDWQEQFNKKFWQDASGEKVAGWLVMHTGKLIPNDDMEFCKIATSQDVKAFIQSLLDKQKQELLEKLTLRNKWKGDGLITGRDEVYQEACDDLESLKKSL
jgi:chromosome condensin MukBEF ATPase and DNA-binding subunit MukB